MNQTSEDVVRCPWAKSERDILYHDQEWGVPLHDERALFELLILEGAQAGLSWSTVLAKRERYREVFENFEVERVANLTDAQLEKILLDPGIIRNRLKVFSTVKNAKGFLKIQKEFGSFDHYLWGYVSGQPIKNHFKEISEVPTSTELSDRLSRDLKKRGFSFIGTTICYAYLQATGVVCDHLTTCHKY